MHHTFISGIPTAEKSFLAEKIVKEHNMLHVTFRNMVEAEKEVLSILSL